MHLHAAPLHFFVVKEAVTHSRGAHAGAHCVLKEELVRGNAIQLHLVQNVPDEIRPAWQRM